MTLPALIISYQKQETAAKVKKVYSVLSQAHLRAAADNGEYQYWDNDKSIGAEEYFNRYYKPYLSIIKVCDDYCGYESGKPWLKMNGDEWEFSVYVNNYRLPCILADGTLVVFSVSSGSDNPDDAENNNYIYFDINADRPPNKLGRDTFIFTRSDKGILPFGVDNDEATINKDCSKTGGGRRCAAKIMRDGWQLAKDYPW